MKYLKPAQLADHPKNVRAQAKYDPAGLASLAASIAAHGLLQSLVVQQLDDGLYGVLAGRRRMLAIRHLEEAGQLLPGFKIPVRVIDRSEDHVTAMSLAENILQEPMSALDEYEAFAAMQAEGAGAEEIAAVFGTTVRAVKERLRYGLVHPDIRAAARAKTITLDVMKAYAGHPCLEVQKRVFDGFAQRPAHDHREWTVRRELEDQDIRAADPLGVYVIEAYRARGGEVMAGLFEEDTVLRDRALAEAIRDEQLQAAAEDARAAHGFAWAEARPAYDYGELSAYGRIYEKPRDLDEAEEARLSALSERIDAILEEMQALEDAEQGEAGEDAYRKLQDEYDRLEDEADRLQNDYDPQEAARAGVIAVFGQNGSVRLERGLVRPEDRVSGDGGRPGAVGENDSSAAEVTAGGAGDGPLTLATTEAKLSQALIEDLATERAVLVAAALAEDPQLASDAMVFRAAASFFSPYNSVGGLDFTLHAASRPHSRKEVMDPEPEARITEICESLDLSFLDDSLSPGARFRAFRRLDAVMKARILAVTMAGAVMPAKAPGDPARESFADALAFEAVPELHAVWRPAGENYFSRVSKAHMLAMLVSFGMEAEAAEYAPVKKAALVSYMEKLFAAPFATLTAEQRQAVECWMPGSMALRPSAPAEDASEPSHDIPVNEGDDDASSFTEEIPAAEAEPGRADPVAA